VARRAEALIPVGQRPARPVAAVTEDTVVARQAEAPTPVGQCPARRVAADIAAHPLAADPTAAHRVEDLEEAAPEADRMAALPVADTITAKKISTPFHPTPHSPSGGSARSLLSSPGQSGEDGRTDSARQYSGCKQCRIEGISLVGEQGLRS